tara:strand:+ start:472 stop:714 length:243 start_codon:yes stop_codon:yes gene_type:complete
MRRLMVPIHIRIPMRMLEEIEEASGSRSHFIRTAITKHLNDDAPTVADAGTRQLMAALVNRDDVDSTLRLLLKAMLENGV